MIYLVISIVLFVLINLYFRIADRFNIIDKPNQRSSHTNITIRGGGVIFPVGYLIYLFIAQDVPAYFTIGLFAISIVSFLDDVYTLSNKIRLPIHFASMGLLFYETGMFDYPIIMIFLFFIVAVGIINAYNFMDGINGINGLYSLAVLGSIYWANQYLSVIDSNALLTLGVAILIFGIYNFRKKAKCFAGDVGSVSMAFIVIYFIIKLILATGDFSYVLFLLVYGVDSIFTIIQRLMRKENIFKAHRTHLYQYLCNELKMPHLLVSFIYATVQLFISGLLIINESKAITSSLVLSLTLITVLSAIYLLLKRSILIKIKSV